MTTIFLALLPVFIVILLGYGLRRFGVIATEQWAGLDHICYFVLFPAISPPCRCCRWRAPWRWR